LKRKSSFRYKNFARRFSKSNHFFNMKQDDDDTNLDIQKSMDHDLLDVNYLNTLTKEELIQMTLEKNNKKKRKLGEEEEFHPRKRKKRELDWSLFSKRFIAIKFLYFGWDYSGLQFQPGEEKTIENTLINALKRVALIPENATLDTIQYSRCGRTDRGVNAFSQVSSFIVRSQVKEGKGIISQGTKLKEKEYDFVKMINSALPNDIKILSWTPVDFSFNSRFAARNRTYLYLFLQEDLDIELMRSAGKQFEGDHDFFKFLQDGRRKRKLC